MPPESVSTRADQIARLEQTGSIVRDCPGCKRVYEAENPVDVCAPHHKASPRCESGGHPHCTCDVCF